MRKILYNKRAELTTQQIVILIILITSFLVILFFIFRLNFQSESSKQICHNSIVLRGNAALPGAVETIPLNCKQTYVCITEDGSCESMSSYDYRLVVKDKEEMYFALAEEMKDCWWMYGEGKINYVGDELLKDQYCSICSQIRFDNSVKEDIFPKGEIDKTDFYLYFLAKKNIPGKEITYAEYLFGSNDLIKLLNSKEITSFGKIDLKDSKKDYIVIMGISSETSSAGWAIVSAGVVGTIALGIVTFGISVPFMVGAIIVVGVGTAGAIGGALVATTVDGLSGNTFIVPTIIPYPSDEYEGLGCKEIKSLS